METKENRNTRQDGHDRKRQFDERGWNRSSESGRGPDGHEAFDPDFRGRPHGRRGRHAHRMHRMHQLNRFGAHAHHRKMHRSHFRPGSRNAKLGCALFIVLLGVLLLAFNLGWIPAAFKGVIFSWQMLIVLLGVIGLVRQRYYSGSFLVLLGGFFLLPVINSNFPGFLGNAAINFQAYWPVLLIAAGVLFILARFTGKKHDHHRFGGCRHGRHKYCAEVELKNDADYVDKNTLFHGGSEQIIFSDDFKGGDINVGFGEMKLDLRKVTKVNPQNLLEVQVLFGTVVIYMPAEWYLNLRNESTFGELDDKRSNPLVQQPDEEAADRTVLNMGCSSMFGRIEIRDID